MTPYYDDGTCVIYHGDCREVDAWLTADVLVTDPPYGMGYSSGWKKRPIANDDSTAVRDAVLEMWGERPAIVFGRWNIPHPKATHTMLTWDKGDWPGMGNLKIPWGPSTEEVYVLGRGFVGKRSCSVLRVNRLNGTRMVHPNEKPEELLELLIAKCPPGCVADPFMGSGSTLLAAKNLGHRAIGVESDEKYCEIAVKRLQQ